MKKKIFIAIMLVASFAVFAANGIIQPKTTKYRVKAEGRTVYIYMTEIYSSEYWAEVYMDYEEEEDTYDEAVATKIIYEFISKYKVEHKFSIVEIEDLKGPSEGEKDGKIIVKKRLIFRQIRK